MSALSFNSEC